MNPAIAMKLARARSFVDAVTKRFEADTGSYKYRYASLGDVIAAVDHACEQAGLAWSQEMMMLPDGGYQLMTVLIDPETGENEMVGGPSGPVKGDPQALGSSLTYFRRYALVTTFGLVVEDDDGRAAAQHERAPEGRTPAEVEVRQIIAGLSKEDRREFVSDFKASFGVGLTDLPTGRHGDALGYAKWWTSDERTDETEYTQADQAADTGDGY